MKDSSKLFIAFGVGLIAGGVAGHYLNSDEGRVARRRAAKQIKKNTKVAADKMNEMAETAKSAIHNVAEEAKSYISQASDHTRELIGDVKHNFEEGMEMVKTKTKALGNKVKSASENNA